jgi:Flp pilus assembly protein TadD
MREQSGAIGGMVAALQGIDGVGADRARLILRWCAGDLDEARAGLERLTRVKRPRADLYWWLGRVLGDQGELVEARTAIETYLERAGKQAVHRVAAEALMATWAQ